MTTEDKASKLVEFIRKLSDFSIVSEKDGNYHHLGATIADAVLQANIRKTTSLRMNEALPNKAIQPTAYNVG